MKHDLRARLTLVFKDKKTASSISDALAPDNINIPRGMAIRQGTSGNSITIEVEAETKASLETLISTLDEFVSHVYSATQTLGRIDSISNDRHKDPERDARKSKGKSRKEEHH